MSWPVAALVITAIIGGSATLVAKFMGNGNGNSSKKDIGRLEGKIDNFQEDLKTMESHFTMAISRVESNLSEMNTRLFNLVSKG